MTLESLREEISIELDHMGRIVGEVSSLRCDVEGRTPTVREKTAAAAFLAQFYGGVENIMKRFHRYFKVPLPAGETWHLDLFNRFCRSGHKKLPLLFTKKLALTLAPLRKFRHVVHHGYGFQIEWEMMGQGLANLENVYSDLKLVLETRLDSLSRRKPEKGL